MIKSINILLFIALLAWHTHFVQAKSVSKRQLCSGGGCGSSCGSGGCIFDSDQNVNVRAPLINSRAPIYQTIDRTRIIDRPTPIQTCTGGGCGSSCTGGGCIGGSDRIVDVRGPDIAPIDQRYYIDRPTPIQSCTGGGCGSSCSGGGCIDGRIVDVRGPDIAPIDQRTYIDRPTPVQTCSGGRCDSSCSGGGCSNNANRITTGAQYNEIFSNIDRTAVINRPAPPQTCSSCIRGCSNDCTTNRCVNTCLNTCSCTDNTRIISQETLPQNENQCCQVLHPKECFTEESGNKRCVVRRHRECSGLCTSSVVSIHESEGTGNRGCQYIRNYPYVYCGNYERSNCGQCYNCDGAYNPRECSRRSECTESCRNNAVRYY